MNPKKFMEAVTLLQGGEIEETARLLINQFDMLEYESNAGRTGFVKRKDFLLGLK